MDNWIDNFQKAVHNNSVNHDFWEDGIDDYIICTKLALIHSEVTEILEAIRKEQGIDQIESEFADVLIRLLDLYQAMQDAGMVKRPLSEVASMKHEVNTGRAPKHDRRF